MSETTAEVEPIGFDNTDYSYNPLPPGPPPENVNAEAERVIPYTPTGANPSYPQDVEAGFEQAAVEEIEEAEETGDGGETQTQAEAPAEAEPDGAPEAVLTPADIPPPPEMPEG